MLNPYDDDYELSRLRYLAALEALNAIEWVPEQHQIPPDPMPFLWLLQAGRGAGKTAAASRYITDHVHGPPCIRGDLPHRVSLIAPTLGDAIESADLTDMALTRLDPSARLTQQKGGSMVRYTNGSQVRLFGTYTQEDVERLRAGGNRCLVWAEELAAWRRLKEAWDHMMFGLRLGDHPHIIATTTPKPRPAYKKLLTDHGDDLIMHTATTADNPHLNPEQRKRLYSVYDGTSLGKQELHGELIDEAEGAIWSFALIEADRMKEIDHDALSRVVVPIDPPGGATEAGITAIAEMKHCPCEGPDQPHFGVLDDWSAKLSPEGWASRGIALLEHWSGDRVLGEMNFGGDMVESTLRNVDPSVPFGPVRASRGKRIRAEPVKALYEKHRVHHIGEFPDLEGEMVSWVPDESEWSPNRLDSLVWGLTYLAGIRQREWGAA